MFEWPYMGVKILSSSKKIAQFCHEIFQQWQATNPNSIEKGLDDENGNTNYASDDKYIKFLTEHWLIK